MVLFGRRTGLYGRSLLTFGKRRKNKNAPETTLPAHRFTPGDIVGLSYSNKDGNVSELSSGIVTRVSSLTIVVAFDESLDSDSFDEDALLRLTRLANDITHKRMKRALETLCSISSFPCGHLVDVVFGQTSMGEPLNLAALMTQSSNNAALKLGQDTQYFNPNLNQSQREAVQFALSRKELAVIHGPPGTGKTTTVVEVITQAVKHCQLKILACAPSNIAVDNIVEKLAQHKIKVVRLGHPARVLETIQGYSLDAILDSSDGTAIVKDVRKDIDKTQAKLKSCHNRGERTRLRSEMKTLRRELREREEKALKQILQNAEVILATNVSASQDGPLKYLPKDHFDVVVIDEAAQSLEAACWIPLLWAPRCILAGDHQQLPPTILSRDAAKRGLETTLMERVIEQFGDNAVHMLTTQYRMNEKIMLWSSEQLYNSKLLAHCTVAHHLLRDLPEVSNTEVTSLPLLLIDTAGCDLYELQTPEEESKGNEGEAEVVAQHVEALVTSGVKPRDIGVITPYNLQVELLRIRLSQYASLEIKSVDGFQGREKEAIIISMVRSNHKGEIGFLAESRRTNVAVTRARRHLTIVGDSSTVSHDAFLKTLVDYISEHGEVWSAEQYRNQLSGDSVFSLVDRHRGGATSGNDAKSKKPESKSHKTGKTGKTDEYNKTKANATKNTSEASVKNLKDAQNLGNNRHRWTARDHRDNEEQQVGLDRDTEEKRRQVEQWVTSFIQNTEQMEMTFPASLTSQQRFMVHSTAEELELGHVSKGTGDERFVAIFKTSSKESQDENCKGTGDHGAVSKGAEALPNAVDVQPKTDDDVSRCRSCGKSIPSSNLALHEARCQQREQSSTKNTVVEKSAKKVTKMSNQKQPVRNVENVDKLAGKSVKKGKKTTDQKKPVKNIAKSENDVDDFDELVADFIRKDSQCDQPGCGKSTLTVGQTCRYCGKCFCLGHHIPEVHGCSQAAKAGARLDAAAQASGNRMRQSNKEATRKVQLQKKLGTKLKDLEGKRKTKQKEKK